MMRAIAIDDEPLPLDILESYCEAIPFLKLEKTFTQTTVAARYLENHPVDLIFLDINMPSISGIDFYKNLENQTMVIFTTAHSQYAVEGFNLNAIDYLLKPYSPERFAAAVNKANDYFSFLHTKETTQLDHVFVRAEYNLVKIKLSEILYIEGLADYIKIHLEGKKTILSRITMKEMSTKLPATFIRVHRSFIIPKARVESVRNKNILLAGNSIPIGASYLKDVSKALNI
jgi:DNA-binding LytR/AlgR family response regulator